MLLNTQHTRFVFFLLFQLQLHLVLITTSLLKAKNSTRSFVPQSMFC